MPHDQLTNDMNGSQTRLATPESLFSVEEFARLTALRDRAQSRIEAEPEELGLDLRRLQFARWLVQTGRLNEMLTDDQA